MKRLSALVLTLVLAATALGGEWWECAGWSSSAASRHACCVKLQKVAPDTSSNCCAMSQQSRDKGATRARVVVAAPPVLVLAAIDAPNALLALLAVPSNVDASPPHESPVPLYVQHRSLLI